MSTDPNLDLNSFGRRAIEAASNNIVDNFAEQACSQVINETDKLTEDDYDAQSFTAGLAE